MAIVVPEKEASKIISIAKKHNLKAQIIGHVTDKKGVYLRNSKNEEIDLSL